MAHARRRRRLRSRWAGGGGSLPPLASPRAPPWPRAAVPARASVEDATPAEAPPCRTVVPLDHVHRPSTANASAVSTGPPPHGLRSASRRTAVQNGQSIKQYFTANGENEVSIVWLASTVSHFTTILYAKTW
uniref:Uncharacterized protein n=1 Tax=Arundo donax TaxID=35708 RepID=A0A0A9G7W6_ARUDO